MRLHYSQTPPCVFLPTYSWLHSRSQSAPNQAGGYGVLTTRGGHMRVLEAFRINSDG